MYKYNYMRHNSKVFDFLTNKRFYIFQQSLINKVSVNPLGLRPL